MLQSMGLHIVGQDLVTEQQNPDGSLKFSVVRIFTPWTLELKLQYFGHVMRKANTLEKILMLGKTEDRRRRG